MILIFSHNFIDEPTNRVIDWLLFFNADFKRINGDEFSPKNNFTLDLVDCCLKKDGQNFLNPNDVSVVWFRRWFNPRGKLINYDGYKLKKYNSDEILLIEYYEIFLENELKAYSKGIFSLLNDKVWLPDERMTRGGLNKIDVLVKAKKIGLLIPESIITSSKTEVVNFLKVNESLITKPIFEVVPIVHKNDAISMLTKEVKMEDIEKFPDLFYPSLFQKKVEKEFELRVFIYKDKIYSIAMFTQNDEQTKVDFRNINVEKPNRYVPFLLPKSIENKLLILMNDVKLNTGTLDLMVNDKNEFIFLEINPIGQFGMVSIGGNFHIEKMIAEDLIEYDENYDRI